MFAFLKILLIMIRKLDRGCACTAQNIQEHVKLVISTITRKGISNLINPQSLMAKYCKMYKIYQSEVKRFCILLYEAGEIDYFSVNNSFGA